jgi:transcriptional regulator with XRE-family HTH domain
MTKPMPTPLRFRDIANIILKKRQALNYTQSQLADRSGVSRNQVLNIEAGMSLPTLPTLYLLAAALKCKPRDLLP